MEAIMGLFNKDKQESGSAENSCCSIDNAAWKKKMSSEQYRIMREEGTERAFTSPLNDEKRNGSYYCAGCGQLLYKSDAKYNSGTGWPSFFQPAAQDAVATSTDHKLGVARTEVHCAKCEGHLGHVFPDGPQPTGQRYCMNGLALRFEPSEGE
jgi:peptide-methionine (R)-S-oxide reductase